MNQKIILLLLALFSINVFAENPRPYVPHKVNDQVYLVTQIWPGGNNINFGIVIGDDGVLLINSMMNDDAPALEAFVATLTDKPIKYVLNSDSDNYNHHANRYFAQRGATIYSQENFKYVNGFHQVLFAEKLTLPMGKEPVVAHHTPAHQLNHILIHLPKSNVIYLSDAFKGHWLAPTGPNGLAGYLAAVDLALSLADDDTIISSGNSSKTPQNYFYNKTELLRARKIHVDLTHRVGELVEQGMGPKAIAQDAKIIAIASQVENYPVFGDSLHYFIETMIDIDFAKAYPLTQQQKLDYVGRYTLLDKNAKGENNVMEVVLENDRLYARQAGKFHFELTALSATKFDLKANRRSDHLVFERTEKGKVNGLTVNMEEKSWYRQVLPSGKRLKMK